MQLAHIKDMNMGAIVPYGRIKLGAVYPSLMAKSNPNPNSSSNPNPNPSVGPFREM